MMKRNYSWMVLLAMVLLAFSTNTGKAANLLVNTTSDIVGGSLRATITAASAGDQRKLSNRLNNDLLLLEMSHPAKSGWLMLLFNP